MDADNVTLFGFPIGRIKSETIFPIGIAHWSKWPNQIFQKKREIQKFSFGPPLETMKKSCLNKLKF